MAGIQKGVKPRINFKVIHLIAISIVLRCTVNPLCVTYSQELTKFVQGYLIGNPGTDVDYDFNSFVPFAHGMGLISNDMYEVCGSALMLILFIHSYSRIYPTTAEIYILIRFENKICPRYALIVSGCQSHLPRYILGQRR